MNQRTIQAAQEESDRALERAKRKHNKEQEESEEEVSRLKEEVRSFIRSLT